MKKNSFLSVLFLYAFSAIAGIQTGPGVSQTTLARYVQTNLYQAIIVLNTNVIIVTQSDSQFNGTYTWSAGSYNQNGSTNAILFIDGYWQISVGGNVGNLTGYGAAPFVTNAWESFTGPPWLLAPVVVYEATTNYISDISSAPIARGLVSLNHGTNFVPNLFANHTNTFSLTYRCLNGVSSTCGVSNIVDGVGFTIFSGLPMDTNQVDWVIFSN